MERATRKILQDKSEKQSDGTPMSRGSGKREGS